MAAKNSQYNGKIPKMSDVLQGICGKTCCNIPQKTSTKEFTNKNSLTKQILFQNVGSNFL